MPFSPFDPRPLEDKRPRFRLIPVRMLLPNLITLLALCAGLTAIRLAVEDKLEWAVAAIVFAALLDGIDGRIARMLKGTSRFGAELHSLADVLSATGLLRQAGGQAHPSRDGAARLRHGGVVLCAADFLSLGRAHHWHGLLSREPAGRLPVLPPPRAQGRGSRERRDLECPRRRSRTRAQRGIVPAAWPERAARLQPAGTAQLNQRGWL